MANLLCIETSTRVCSVGILRDGDLLSIREDQSMNYSHSAVLTVFIENVLNESGLTAKDLDGVAVSQGPGSYTGLRIGVSAAKGVCYALDIPLMAIDTLQAMASLCLETKTEALNAHPNADLPLLLCPMIDARRMEVYHALFDTKLKHVEPTQAKVVEEGSFEEWLSRYRVAFFGDGASKCKTLLQHPNALIFDDVFPSVKGMMTQTTEKFQASAFVDVAYFEPFYLKDFVAGIPKVKGLYR
ncbi:MAG: tRNA (adenosine(37)-N6)-threonylcarbamoyltransferase complex dimerization subunit type 1 TsaB [Bacteroides sp.]|jgi:tRNA threonylcarbamoyladenosine biosynthesis protein TsaB|nr:tRNA (adenosine(37)-N6)-threonylcarbamoyltransferase complex dimerization subunit type 1 TsaB [Bacteroides sp.]